MATQQWTVQDTEDYALIIDGDGKAFAMVNDGNRVRLIAAAPDLLDALEAIVAADREGELCNDHIAHAIDAIAKARP